MIELRMTEEARRRIIRMNLIFAWCFAPVIALPGIVQLAFGNWPWALPYIAIAFAAVALTYALVIPMVRNTRFVYGDGTYSLSGWGRSRRFTASEAARVVTVNRMALSGGIAGASHFLIVAGQTKRLLIMAGQMWSVEQLSAVALDLQSRGVPLTPLRDPLTPVQLRAHDRRLMPWWQAHPVAFGLLVALGVLIVIVTAFVSVVAVFIA